MVSLCNRAILATSYYYNCHNIPVLMISTILTSNGFTSYSRTIPVLRIQSVWQSANLALNFIKKIEKYIKTNFLQTLATHKFFLLFIKSKLVALITKNFFTSTTKVHPPAIHTISFNAAIAYHDFSTLHTA